MHCNGSPYYGFRDANSFAAVVLFRGANSCAAVVVFSRDSVASRCTVMVSVGSRCTAIVSFSIGCEMPIANVVVLFSRFQCWQ